MNKFWMGLIFTFAVAMFFELIGFWQGLVIAGFIGSLIQRKTLDAFIGGFFGCLLCSLTILVYGAALHEVYPLIDMTAEIFMLPGSMSWLLFIFTLLMSGILGGLGSLTGFLWKRVLFKPKVSI